MVDGADSDAPATEALRRDLYEAREQVRATGEVLRALGRSASDLDHVFGAVVHNARRLCHADAAQLHLHEEGAFRSYRLADHSGLTDEFRAFMAEHPIVSDRSTLVGRVGLHRTTLQIADVLADPEYGRPDAQRLGHYRSIMGAPMLVGDEVVGVLSVWRNQVDPFSQRAVELLTSFAAQAAIAVQTAGLVKALEQRGAELARKVDQLEALGAVGEAVSSSLDLDEVLSTIVTHAVALSGTDGGSILEFDPDANEFRVRTAYGTSPDVLDALRRIRLGLHDTLVGQAALERHPLQAPDLADRADDVHLQVLRDAGWRSVVAVPMLRQDRVVGALVVRRRSPGTVDDETCEFLQTFASQSSLALVNAQLYRRLEGQSAELAVASRHKSEFLASMSHELRTPLNAIIGFSEVLLERMFGELNDRQDEYLHDIHSSGRHLLALLNDILDLSKVEAGQMVLDPTVFSVREVLEQGVGLVRERAVRHGIAVSVEVDDDVGTVDADELRFRQVVLNLLSNAVKFTPDGGSVTVRATRLPAEVAVTVTDTGDGVPEADRERIFESFQQGTRAPGAHEGTGLGLTLCRRIVALHGGRMWLESEVGRGSTFGFAVPSLTPAELGEGPGADETTAAAAEHAADDGGRATVLLVEDDRSSRDLMRVLLEDQGLRVVAVPTGEEALRYVERARPVAVVLDIKLPGIDGWEVLARLKENPRTGDVPVIVVSILDEPGHGFALGADDYLVKPVDRDLLVSTLRRNAVVPAEPRSVLVIDGDDGSVREVTAALRSAGWTVEAAASPGAGLEAARRSRPGVVLLDLLAAGDRFDVVERLRADPATRDVPLVALLPADLDQADWERLAGRLSLAARAGDFRVDALPGLLDRVVGSGTTPPQAPGGSS
ncbi:MAG TPA: GAF domain-containing protein [Jiangellales bacterium]|nr:GAF domain-containing protein [Jiangellales bacterium]